MGGKCILFLFNNPTRIIFGQDIVNKLENIAGLYGTKVLLVYGKGSAYRTGIYDKVINILKKIKLEIFELPGIVANPRLDKCEEGISICKVNKIDFLIGLGGGSVLDTAKAISAGALAEGDVWDFFEKEKKDTKSSSSYCYYDYRCYRIGI